MLSTSRPTHRRLRSGLLVLLGFWSPATPAGPSVDLLLTRLSDFYRNSAGVAADFVQTLHSRSLPRPQKESGTVFLKPPGRMRWSYSIPEGKLALTDGVNTFLYLPEDHQVLVGKIEHLDEGSVASRLLLGGRPLQLDFQISQEPLPDMPGWWSLKLAPRDPDFPYDAVEVELEEERGIIRRIQLVDPLGNRIEYRFENVRVVADLPDRLFSYEIPTGADVQQLDGLDDTDPDSP